MARVFQALRIEVNKEMEVLEALLRQSLEVLNPGGRLVILTYHSLEDRLVKNYFRTGNFEGKLEKDFYGNITFRKPAGSWGWIFFSGFCEGNMFYPSLLFRSSGVCRYVLMLLRKQETISLGLLPLPLHPGSCIPSFHTMAPVQTFIRNPDRFWL